MKIIVNQEEQEVAPPAPGASISLAHALVQLGYHEAMIATAVNDMFVPLSARETYALHAQDRLEILAPMQGG